MSQVLARVVRVLLVIGLIYFGLWALNQFGVVQMKSMILQLVSLYPGLEDAPYNYELGQKQSALLKQQQQKLKQDQESLAAAQAKLNRERVEFEEAQLQWNREHPATKNGNSVVNNTGNKIVPGQLNPPRTSEAKIKEYLTMLGQMRPKQAASVIQKLPEETIFTIFDQLRRDQVIKIMENLPESFLAKLTMDRLNQYRDL